VTQRVTDLWTGYEHHAGRWYAMYCNVDLDQSERNKRDDLVWVRNNEVATAAAEIASLRAKLAAVCEAAEDAIGYAHQHDSEGRITFIDRSQPIAQYSDDGPDAWPARLHAAIAAAREGEK